MTDKHNAAYCSVEQGEIFPSMVLSEQPAENYENHKGLRSEFVRACHKEMMDNYNKSH